MLGRSYSFAIEDLEDEGPQPAEDERLAPANSALREPGSSTPGGVN